MQIYSFISSQKQLEFWDGSYTQEFNEPCVFEEFKDGSDVSLPFLPVSLQSECVYTRLKPSHKRIISAVTTLFSRKVWSSQEFPVSNRFTRNSFRML